MPRDYVSKVSHITWTCIDCDKGSDKGGHYASKSHSRASGHRVLVTQTVEYLYHYPSPGVVKWRTETDRLP